MILLTTSSGPRYLADQRRELEGWTSHPEGRTLIPAGIRVLSGYGDDNHGASVTVIVGLSAVIPPTSVDSRFSV